MKKAKSGPKILIFDIETIYMEVYAWNLWEQNIPYTAIKKDWSVISWAAKWLDDKKVLYQDNRASKDIRNDKKLLEGIHKLLDEADIVITQNGKKFDSKKLNARFIINGMKPPSPYKHIDTKQIASSKFAFSSNSLDYMTDKLNLKYKKLKHKQFPGISLWDECLAGNLKAWKEMERYNKHDVLATEELYKKLYPWDSSVDFNLYREGTKVVCNCGSSNITKQGFKITKAGKFQQYKCQNCGTWTTDQGVKNNLLSKEKRNSLKVKA